MNTTPYAPSVRCGADVTLLNNGCFCVTLDRDAVRRAFDAEVPQLAQLVEQRCPHIFAAHPVFVEQGQIARIAQLVQAVESVVALPAYREQVLAGAPLAAQHDSGAKSVFFGYDFHLHAQGISLIEINTNAGGAMLNAVLARAQRGCCADVEALFPPAPVQGPEAAIVRMFLDEWRYAGRNGAPRSIAIVDTQPEQQYLYPEFLLFRELFQRHGIEAVIADPAGLHWDGQRLRHGDREIDLVYNRHTDFALEQPASAALLAAWLGDGAVITPHPRAHALYADKRNLCILSDDAQLTALGVPADTRAILLASIPRTQAVLPSNAERLWSERRRLFFKPQAGYGGRATYRGDKLTRRVWEEILKGGYVAQDMIAAGERIPAQDADALKFDVRAYAYDGQVQALTARLYQGQTTNFRTPGGGFAPVYAVPSMQAGQTQQPTLATILPCAA